MKSYKLAMPNFGQIIELWSIPIDLDSYQHSTTEGRSLIIVALRENIAFKCKPNFTVFEETTKQGLEATRVAYRSASHASKPILFLSEPNRISAQPSGHLKRACAVNRGSCLDKRQAHTRIIRSFLHNTVVRLFVSFTLHVI